MAGRLHRMPTSNEAAKVYTKILESMCRFRMPATHLSTCAGMVDFW